MRRYLRGGTQTSPTFTQVGSAFGRFSTIGGMGLRPDGRLLVADDPAIVTPGEPLGIGRLTQVGSPAARIASGPSNLPDTTARVAGVTANPTPAFTLEGDAALRCWLREADTPAGHDAGLGDLRDDVHAGRAAG